MHRPPHCACQVSFIGAGSLCSLLHWQGMYPTLIIIVCAVDKSLYEKSTEDNVPDGSIMFDNASPSRRRGTLSELVSATSTYHDAVSEDIAGPPEHLSSALEGAEEAALPLPISTVNVTQ